MPKSSSKPTVCHIISLKRSTYDPFDIKFKLRATLSTTISKIVHNKYFQISAAPNHDHVSSHHPCQSLPFCHFSSTFLFHVSHCNADIYCCACLFNYQDWLNKAQKTLILRQNSNVGFCVWIIHLKEFCTNWLAMHALLPPLTREKHTTPYNFLHIAGCIPFVHHQLQWRLELRGRIL